VRVGQDHGEIAPAHLRMPPPTVWSLEAQLSQPAHQIIPRNWDQPGHGTVSRRLRDLVEVHVRNDGD
jgi:hypothetical protein